MPDEQECITVPFWVGTHQLAQSRSRTVSVMPRTVTSLRCLPCLPVAEPRIARLVDALADGRSSIRAEDSSLSTDRSLQSLMSTMSSISDSSDSDTSAFAPCIGNRVLSKFAEKWSRMESERERHRMVTEGLAAEERAKTGGPMPQRVRDDTYVTAKYWGITRNQLEELYYDCRQDPQWRETDSVSDLVKKFIKPKTVGTGMGLALLLNKDEPKKVNLMISHAWQENAMNFFDDVLDHVLEHEVAYICFLSNYQGTEHEIDAQLGNDINRSPFTEVLQSKDCQRLLVVPNEELRNNGQGLYSRLWCDWEIYVAASAGLPIHITKRNSLDYLFGPGNSSRDARCGNPCLPPNKDEKFIREAIERMHPEHGKFQAWKTYFFAMSIAYGPRIVAQLAGARTQSTWLGGYLAGMAVAFVVIKFVSRPLRHWADRRRNHDGYKKLDGIIKSVARKEYYHRRFRLDHDLPDLLVPVFGCSIGFSLFRLSAWCENGTGRASEAMCAGCIEGIGYGMMMWSVWNINGLGPWTGVYVERPRMQWVYGFFTLCCILSGSCLGKLFLARQGMGQGALWGLLVALITLSLSYKRWRYSLGLAFALAFLICIHHFMNARDLSMVWRDAFIAVLGVSGLHLIPNWSWKQWFVGQVVGYLGLAGLVVGDYFNSVEPQRVVAAWSVSS